MKLVISMAMTKDDKEYSQHQELIIKSDDDNFIHCPVYMNDFCDKKEMIGFITKLVEDMYEAVE